MQKLKNKAFMLLVIIRHAEAASSAISDELRPLTAQGQADASSLGQLLARARLELAHIEHSPLLRAQQTAKSIADSFSGASLEQNSLLAPGPDIYDLEASIRHAGHSSMALVFHAPDVSLLASSLLHMSSSSLAFSPGTAMGLKIQGQSCHLLWQIHPLLYRSFL
jgi:phosphohistidine phosphatase SixA